MRPWFESPTHAASLLRHNPRAFRRRLRRYFLRAKSGSINIHGVQFKIDLDLDPAMYDMFYGNYQEGVVRVLERYLRNGDTFLDVGANVGYVSAFALGLVGTSGSVHAFEPVPRYFTRLQKLQQDNPEYDFHVNNLAVGDSRGTARIAVSQNNIGANTMLPSRMRRDGSKEDIEVSVITLTDYLGERNVSNLRLVKIDVEGYEFRVIKGFVQYLREADEPPVLVIEISPPAFPEVGASLGEFASLISELGYSSRSIDCASEIQIEQLSRLADVVFVPHTMVS